MTFGEYCGIGAMIIIAYGGFVAVLFYWSNRMGMR